MKIALLGTVGVPGRYGGFETLAENLVNYHVETKQNSTLTVWCSGKNNAERPARFKSAELRYVSLHANGIQSILYDAISLWRAVRSGHDCIILLGVSGAISLPLIRLISRARIVTNIDGIEWKREKWSGLARTFLRASEWAAVRFSHAVIADNQIIADHVRDSYACACHIIAYGGDHALVAGSSGAVLENLPDSYALALCRIEPENNVHMILKAWTQLQTPLVFVGNWANSLYGRELMARYADEPKIHLLEPIYEPSALHAVRARTSVYIHGHSAGGTNPSLVEMMHFGVPVLAYDCLFNRHSTENKALYFKTPQSLVRTFSELKLQNMTNIGAAMREIAQRCYTWDCIGAAYFALLDRVSAKTKERRR